MKGKLIAVEGTDCSGKETQTKLLVSKLINEGYKVVRMSFPMYDTPTGKIIGGCYLGKEYICKEILKDGIVGLFEEKASEVDPYVALSYYAADRRYNRPKIIEALDKGMIVILDRYVSSNMAHQGCKIRDEEQRIKMFKNIDLLEYGINEMPRPDMTIFLYMPYEYACILKENREEKADQHENSKEHLKNAEDTYLYLANMYNYETINCINNEKIRTIDDINAEVYKKVIKLF